MKTKGIKMSIDTFIKLYQVGLYTISDCMKSINDVIQTETNTWNVTNVDERIKAQNRLYKYGLSELRKAIIYTEKEH